MIFNWFSSLPWTPDKFLYDNLPSGENIKNNLNEFVVYPTVVLDDIKIINYESQLFEVKIYDIKGRDIFTKKR